MRLPTSLSDNLHFLIAETASQLRILHALFDSAALDLAQRILDREGYTNSLKMRIHDASLAALQDNSQANPFALRAAESVSGDLVQISDLCKECAITVRNLKDPTALKSHKTKRMIADISAALARIETALTDDTSPLADQISSFQQKITKAATAIEKAHVRHLKQSNEPHDLVHILLISQNLATIAQLLRQSSEALISARIGHPMHLSRYKAFNSALSDLGVRDARLDAIAETKSGSTIAGISDKATASTGYEAIFKDGSREKLKEERDSVENWHDIYPGLAPQILGYRKHGKNAALLIEHLQGQTFEQILCYGDDETLDKALKSLTKTLKSVWGATQRPKKVHAQHISQLEKRLPAVLSVHPDFSRPRQIIGAYTAPSLKSLLRQARALEKSMAAPFSVYIHGDFNLDNIIFDPDSKKTRFIDLHRSCYQDYTQDISVFMVSTYRLQVWDPAVRRKITHCALTLYDFAQKFAKKQGDDDFIYRLGFGLARSFLTSTRFILDQQLAQTMALRAVYLLELLVNNPPNSKSRFTLPLKDLFS